MNTLGFAKSGSALIADWDDAWPIFVHFGTDNEILLQNDHAAVPPGSH